MGSELKPPVKTEINNWTHTSYRSVVVFSLEAKGKEGSRNATRGIADLRSSRQKPESWNTSSFPICDCTHTHFQRLGPGFKRCLQRWCDGPESHRVSDATQTSLRFYMESQAVTRSKLGDLLEAGHQ